MKEILPLIEKLNSDLDSILNEKDKMDLDVSKTNEKISLINNKIREINSQLKLEIIDRRGWDGC